MAFNFNWSPLTADAAFYTRARDLLTTALNKSPKPPIIVDDIIVTEFNLGSVPPDLEILEIGDLAEDRFRGIFKMCYSGDAFLTLKTRVQVGQHFFGVAEEMQTRRFLRLSAVFLHPEDSASSSLLPLVGGFSGNREAWKPPMRCLAHGFTNYRALHPGQGFALALTLTRLNSTLDPMRGYHG